MNGVLIGIVKFIHEAGLLGVLILVLRRRLAALVGLRLAARSDRRALRAGARRAHGRAR